MLLANDNGDVILQGNVWRMCLGTQLRHSCYGNLMENTVCSYRVPFLVICHLDTKRMSSTDIRHVFLLITFQLKTLGHVCSPARPPTPISLPSNLISSASSTMRKVHWKGITDAIKSWVNRQIQWTLCTSFYYNTITSIFILFIFFLKTLLMPYFFSTQNQQSVHKLSIQNNRGGCVQYILLYVTNKMQVVSPNGKVTGN